tara:strand:- start:1968 stop:3146 length:1179 start_codon:yes stop_codon:yes gene_type:complete
MSTKGSAFIAGCYEHPTRKVVDKSLAQLHAEVARGALLDAGLAFCDVDAYFCAGDAPGYGAVSMAEYMGLKLKYMDTTETGGSAYVAHIGHAAAAIAAGKCSVALITLAGIDKGQPQKRRKSSGPGRDSDTPEAGFEGVWAPMAPSLYGMAAMRHMHEFGTTSEQLAWIKVAASHHAQHNENAALQQVVTVEDVLNSPMISDPLHRLDCCVITDGGGAIVVVSPEIAKSLQRQCVKVLGHGEAPKHQDAGRVDLTYSGARWSGPRAFSEAGVTPDDIKYMSIYDSFTITVLEAIEDLGFCEKGKGGRYVEDGNLISGVGKIPFNTDGGGLCSNHPANRGGMTKVLEAVRQLRHEAHPKVQVPDCDIALAHGTGGSLGSRMASATVILGREDA